MNAPARIKCSRSSLTRQDHVERFIGKGPLVVSQQRQRNRGNRVNAAAAAGDLANSWKRSAQTAVRTLPMPLAVCRYRCRCCCSAHPAAGRLSRQVANAQGYPVKPADVGSLMPSINLRRTLAGDLVEAARIAGRPIPLRSVGHCLLACFARHGSWVLPAPFELRDA